MTEAYFKRQFMKNWNDQRPDLYRFTITDPKFASKDWHGDKRAVDVLVGYPPSGKLLGLEWKITTNNRALPMKSLRPSQIDTLIRIELCGGLGFFMVGNWNEHTRVKSLYVVPVSMIHGILKYHSDRKSIPIDTFTSYKVDYLKSLKKWDIDRLDRLIHDRI